MSLKDRFANHSENAAEQPQPEEQKSVELYDTAGHARNICFVQADGSMTFLNYAYLVSGELNPQENALKLFFTSHEVILKGNNLSELFDDVLNHKPKKIFSCEKRYVQLEDHQILISEIKILSPS